MSIDRKVHDMKNAMLFLETFPDILEDYLSSQAIPETKELEELFEIYRAKIHVIKASLQK